MIEVVITGFLERDPLFTTDEVTVRVQGFVSGVRHCAEPGCQKPAWGHAPNTRGRFNFEKHVRAYHPPPLKKKAGESRRPPPPQLQQMFFKPHVPPPVAAPSGSSTATPTSPSIATLATREGQDASASETVRLPALSLRSLSLPLTPYPALWCRSTPRGVRSCARNLAHRASS